MNYIYASAYVVICVVFFFIIFLLDETLGFLFKMKFNNITDYNDPDFTGGVTYEFNPWRHFMPTLKTD